MDRCTDMPPDMVRRLTGDCPRLAPLSDELCGCSIWADEEDGVDESDLQRYCEKLEYLTKHIDRLLADAFRAEFYSFYGVNRERVKSPDEMRRRLLVDSFVMYKKDGSVKGCLSNPEFLHGHYIGCSWDDGWKFAGSYIC